MALSDGDPARDGDIWFRIVTHPDHIKNGRAHHGAFSGNAISAPRKQRPWDRELSGRLRSLAGSHDDVIASAEKYCADLTQRTKQTKTFSGIMYGQTEELRQTYQQTIRTGVYF